MFTIDIYFRVNDNVYKILTLFILSKVMIGTGADATSATESRWLVRIGTERQFQVTHELPTE